MLETPLKPTAISSSFQHNYRTFLAADLFRPGKFGTASMHDFCYVLLDLRPNFLVSESSVPQIHCPSMLVKVQRITRLGAVIALDETRFIPESGRLYGI